MGLWGETPTHKCESAVTCIAHSFETDTRNRNRNRHGSPTRVNKVEDKGAEDEILVVDDDKGDDEAEQAGTKEKECDNDFNFSDDENYGG